MFCRSFKVPKDLLIPLFFFLRTFAGNFFKFPVLDSIVMLIILAKNIVAV